MGFAAVLAAVFCASSALLVSSAVDIRLNHIQVIHAHNSYHSCPGSSMVALFNSSIGQQVKAMSNGSYDSDLWSYGHASPGDLLRMYGARSLEFDIYYDDIGGRYQRRAGPKLAGVLGFDKSAADLEGPPELATRGWKVLHVPDFDFLSTCNTLATCLQPVAAWSSANPGHVPLFLHIEFKEWNPTNQGLSSFALNYINSIMSTPEAIRDYGPQTNLTSTPTPDAAHITAMEDEIKEAFGADYSSKLYTPADFKGTYASAAERINQEGWPALSDLAGKVVLLALGSGTYLDLLKAHPTAGQLVFRESFTSSLGSLDDDEVFASTEWRSVVRAAGFAGAARVDPRSMSQQTRSFVEAVYKRGIREMVKGGRVMLRATVDGDTVEARADWQRLSWAVETGGAHFVHTDYPNGRTSQCGFANDYTVWLAQTRRPPPPGPAPAPNPNPSRMASVCNAVTGPQDCTLWLGAVQPAECKCYVKAGNEAA